VPSNITLTPRTASFSLKTSKKFSLRDSSPQRLMSFTGSNGQPDLDLGYLSHIYVKGRNISFKVTKRLCNNRLEVKTLNAAAREAANTKKNYDAFAHSKLDSALFNPFELKDVFPILMRKGKKKWLAKKQLQGNAATASEPPQRPLTTSEVYSGPFNLYYINLNQEHLDVLFDDDIVDVPVDVYTKESPKVGSLLFAFLKSDVFSSGILCRIRSYEEENLTSSETKRVTLYLHSLQRASIKQFESRFRQKPEYQYAVKTHAQFQRSPVNKLVKVLDDLGDESKMPFSDIVHNMLVFLEIREMELTDSSKMEKDVETDLLKLLQDDDDSQYDIKRQVTIGTKRMDIVCTPKPMFKDLSTIIIELKHLTRVKEALGQLLEYEYLMATQDGQTVKRKTVIFLFGCKTVCRDQCNGQQQWRKILAHHKLQDKIFVECACQFIGKEKSTDREHGTVLNRLLRMSVYVD